MPNPADVTLHVSRQAPVSVSTPTAVSGDIKVSAAIGVLQGSSSGRHEYEGRIGDGKARVEVEILRPASISLHYYDPLFRRFTANDAIPPEAPRTRAASRAARMVVA